MRWKLKPEPKIGDIKTVSEFALFPVKVDGCRVWLERYLVDYEYVKYGKFNGYGYYNYYKWKFIKKRLYK